MRGATQKINIKKLTKEFQSTRPMRGATKEMPPDERDPEISIHAPHAGRDRTKRTPYLEEPIFQSTRPMRGATTGDDRAAQQADISIHAPHAGRDQRDKRLQERIDISIHAPHAGRDCRR